MISTFSRIGAQHAQNCEENQDAVCHAAGKSLSVISLADGVSSCKEAKLGAEVASKAVTELFLKKGPFFLQFDETRTAEYALAHVLAELKRQAEMFSGSLEDYSSTLASVLVDKKKKKMLCFSLGDSVILSTQGGKCRVLSTPSDSLSGCCVTTTKHAERMIFVRTYEDISSLESVVICSDGAWREMFSKGRLKPEVARMLSDGGYDALGSFLIGRHCSDDSSFISLTIQSKKGGECA